MTGKVSRPPSRHWPAQQQPVCVWVGVRAAIAGAAGLIARRHGQTVAYTARACRQRQPGTPPGAAAAPRRGLGSLPSCRHPHTGSARGGPAGLRAARGAAAGPASHTRPSVRSGRTARAPPAGPGRPGRCPPAANGRYTRGKQSLRPPHHQAPAAGAVPARRARAGAGRAMAHGLRRGSHARPCSPRAAGLRRRRRRRGAHHGSWRGGGCLYWPGAAAGAGGRRC